MIYHGKNIQTTEQWIFRFMCGFALASSLSIAIQNIFLILALIVLAYRLYVKHDDVKDALNIDKHLLYPFLAWAGAVLLSVAFSSEPLWGLWVFCDYFIYRLMGLFIVLIAIRERQRLMMLLQLCFCSLTIAGGICIYQFLTRKGSWIIRVSGTIPVMSLAGVLSMLVPLLFLGILLLQGKKRLLAIWLTLFSLSTVVLNGTRGMWMAVFFTILSMSLLVVDGWKKKIGIMLVVLISCLTLMTIPYVSKRVHSIANISTDASNTERICLWQSAYRMFQDHPVLGIGFGNFKKEYQTNYILSNAKNPTLSHAHSNIMQMVGECGIVGTIAFLFWWLYSIWYSVRQWFIARKAVYLAMAVVIAGIMIQGLTEYNMGNSLVTKLFWILLAIGIQWIYLSERSREVR